MKTEKERIWVDIHDLESDLDSIEEEMRTLERDYPDTYEDHDAWNNLFHEATEIENAIQYNIHCLEDFDD